MSVRVLHNINKPSKSVNNFYLLAIVFFAFFAFAIGLTPIKFGYYIDSALYAKMTQNQLFLSNFLIASKQALKVSYLIGLSPIPTIFSFRFILFFCCCLGFIIGYRLFEEIHFHLVCSSTGVWCFSGVFMQIIFLQYNCFSR